MSEQEPKASPRSTVVGIDVGHERNAADEVRDLARSIVPVCNQGRCLAYGAGATAAEREQVVELMDRVESLSAELADRCNDMLHEMARSEEDAANLMGRTLCGGVAQGVDRARRRGRLDLATWSEHETFARAISAYAATRAELFRSVQELDLNRRRLASSRVSGGSDAFFQIFREVCDFGSSGRLLTTPEGCSELSHLLHAFRLHVDQLEDPALQSLCGELAVFEEGLENLQNTLRDASRYLERLRVAADAPRALMLVADDGLVIAGGFEEGSLVGQELRAAAWLRDHVGPSTGVVDEWSAESSDFFTYGPVRIDGEFIGALVSVFDPAHASARWLPAPEDAPLEMFMTDERGRVLLSTDEYLMPLGHHAPLPADCRTPTDKTAHAIAVLGGRECRLSSTPSQERGDGARDCVMHLCTPLRAGPSNAASAAELDGQRLLDAMPDWVVDAQEAVQEQKEALHLISLNGLVFSSKLGPRGAAMRPVFDYITRATEQATGLLERALDGVVRRHFELDATRLEYLSTVTVELVHRELDRAMADVRLWGISRLLYESLHEGSLSEAAMSRLQHLVSTREFVTDLVALRPDGVVAGRGGRSAEGASNVSSASERGWFHDAMGGKPVLDLVERRDGGGIGLADGSLLMATAIVGPGDQDAAAGVLVASLDLWALLSRLTRALSSPKDGLPTVGLALDTDGNIIHSSNPDLVASGGRIVDADRWLCELSAGESCTRAVDINGDSYLLAVRRGIGAVDRFMVTALKLRAMREGAGEQNAELAA